MKIVRYNTRNTIYRNEFFKKIKISLKRKRDNCDRKFNYKEDQDNGNGIYNENIIITVFIIKLTVFIIEISAMQLG